jgi:hypothetical protein
MSRNMIVAGLLGGIVVFIWTFIVNGLLGFNARMQMKQLAAEPAVFEILKTNVTAPGRYVVNPQLTEEGRFPENEPVFSVLYGGVGHEAAGRLVLVRLPLFFVPPFIAAWLLTMTSERILSRFSRRFLFVVTIGVLLAVSGPLSTFGIGEVPFRDALIFTLHDIALWVAVGLVIAWKIRALPAEAEQVTS